MQMCVPVRTPRWVSQRRLLEEKLSELSRSQAEPSRVKQAHAQAIRADLHRDLYVAPKLIAAYSLCRQIAIALKVFDQIPKPNAHLYNTLIRAHVKNSNPSRALEAFMAMLYDGVSPDNFTYSFVLKACYGKTSFPLIQTIHAHIEKCGFCADIYVPNSLIDCYCKSGSVGVSAARKVFMGMGVRDVVSWNTMIGGLARFGEVEEARKLFDEMPERDMFSWNTMLDGYAKYGQMDQAFEFFQMMPERNVVSWSTVVLGYTKSGDIDMARMLFDKMPVKNLITWTIMVSGYAMKGLSNEAIELYERMEDSGFKIESGTIISVLSACAESGLLGLGKKVHASIERSRLAQKTKVVNALIDMYAKCGSLEIAYKLFDEMPERDIVSWNAMLHGLAVHGGGERALQLFERMEKEGFSPDSVTFISVLCACSHAGLVKEGLYYFHTMEQNYGITPQIGHYGCLIDLLGRGGCLEEAFRVLKTMPLEPNAVIWGTLLGACRAHNCMDLATEILDRLVKFDPSSLSEPENFSVLSNIYAAAGDWDRVAETRARMRSSGVRKISGASSIELGNAVHEFTAFDESHPRSDEIYRMVGKLSHDLKQIGYVPIQHILTR